MPGLCGSKEATKDETAPTAAPPPPAASPKDVDMASNKKIAVIYYSTYGHIAKLAKAVVEGINAVEGVEAVLLQVPELLPEEVLAKMHAPPKDAAVPIAEAATLDQYDGFAFGFPTRFGSMPAQFKSFLDATGGLWQKGALVGKPVTAFTSTATQAGGQETTILTAVTYFAHQGMIFVPPGYSMGGPMFDMSVVKGGSPWGAGTMAGADGSRQPSEGELAYAKHQGTYFAGVAKKL